MNSHYLSHECDVVWSLYIFFWNENFFYYSNIHFVSYFNIYMNWSSSEMCEVPSTEDQCMYKKIYKQNMYKLHRCFLRVPVTNCSPIPAMVISWLQCLTTIQTCPSGHLLRVVSQHKYSPCSFLQYTQTKMTRISEHHSEHSILALCIRS